MSFKGRPAAFLFHGPDGGKTLQTEPMTPRPTKIRADFVVVTSWREYQEHDIMATAAPIVTIDVAARPDLADVGRVLRLENCRQGFSCYSEWYTERPRDGCEYLSLHVQMHRPVECAFALVWPVPKPALYGLIEAIGAARGSLWIEPRIGGRSAGVPWRLAELLVLPSIPFQASASE